MEGELSKWALGHSSLGKLAQIVCHLPLHYSTHGFCIGHVVPEAFEGGPIGLLKDGDIVTIDAEKNTLDVEISDAEMAERRKAWKPREPKVTQGRSSHCFWKVCHFSEMPSILITILLSLVSGTLWKYIKNVTDASHGAITDLYEPGKTTTTSW